MRGTGWLNDFYRNDQKNWTQERVCERCEKKYTATARRQKYCLDCKEIVPQERYRKKNPKAKLIGETLECPTCQTTFEKSKPSQEYCSFKCAYTQRKKRMVEKYRAEHPDYTPKAEATIASDTTKFCLFCEKEFVFRHPNQMHCSHACKVKSLDKRRDRSGASRQADESICPTCAKSFIKTHGNQKYCSRACGGNLSTRERNLIFDFEVNFTLPELESVNELLGHQISDNQTAVSEIIDFISLHFDSKIAAGEKLEKFEAILDRQIRNDYSSVVAYVGRAVDDNFDTK